MKAIVTLQFGNFSRTLLVVEHEVSTDLAGLGYQLRRIPGVRNAAIIVSHLQEVKVVGEAEDPVEVVKQWAASRK